MGAVIFDADGWRITSYGNGVAYLVEDTANGSGSVLMQGDAAAGFSNDLNSGRREWPDICADYAEILSVEVAR